MPCLINGKSYPLHRIETRIPPCDPIAWLNSQSLYPKVFWKEKGSPLTHAAVGELLTFSEIPHIAKSNPINLRLYGGVHFQETPSQDPTWNLFPSSHFWLPKVELTQHIEHMTVTTYTKDLPIAEASQFSLLLPPV